MSNYQIALIPGDGIGQEVIPAAVRVLDKAAALGGFSLTYQTYDYSCEHYAKHDRMMPDDGLERLRDSDGIFLGAVGFPGVPDHVSLWGPAHPHPTHLPAVREPASGAPAQGRHVAAEKSR